MVRGDLPVEYSYNQAEFIAAMNRDVGGVINPEPADDLNTTVNKTKEPTSESNRVLFSIEKNNNETNGYKNVYNKFGHNDQPSIRSQFVCIKIH